MDMEFFGGLILLILTGIAFMRSVQIEPRTKARVFWIRFKRASFVYLIAFLLAVVIGFLKGFF